MTRIATVLTVILMLAIQARAFNLQNPNVASTSTCPGYLATSVDYQKYNASQTDVKTIEDSLRRVNSSDRQYVRWMYLKKRVLIFLQRPGDQDLVLLYLPEFPFDENYNDTKVNHLYVFPCTGDLFAGPPVD